VRDVLKWAAGALGVAAGAYAGCVGVTWLRYGNPAPASAEGADPPLDRFMPAYDVVERHHIHVAAPAEITFAAAGEQDLMAGPLVRAIFRAREVVLGSEPDAGTSSRVAGDDEVDRLGRAGGHSGS
jgi:hypothetical protein